MRFCKTVFGMRFCKEVIAIMLVIMAFNLCTNNVAADDGNGMTGAGDVQNVSSVGDGSAAPDNIQPVFEPKVMVESYTFSEKTIYAGDKVKVNVVLHNTSTNNAVKNMMVTAGIENEYMQLTSKTDSIYIPYISAGGRYNVSFSFKTKADTPPGQYNLLMSMDYADKDGTTYSATGNVKVNVVQKAKVKFDSLIINSEAEIGDTIEAQINAMNLGNSIVKNVRAEIKADGLTPKGTLYIGNIEAGAMGTATVQIAVGGMTNGDEVYGETTGKITYYYESVTGKKHKLKKNFTMNIKPLSVNVKADEKPDNTGQWWTAVAITSGIILLFGGVTIVGIIKKKNGVKQKDV